MLTANRHPIQIHIVYQYLHFVVKIFMEVGTTDRKVKTMVSLNFRLV